ncbi:MAG TPA: phospho-sugar mutase, partial [Acidimicrobiales bacterium]
MERPDQLLAEARAWVLQDPDPDTAAALSTLIDAAEDGHLHAWTALGELFDGRLAFGTAGLRGALGPGPMRMNRVVVRQAAAGLARWLGPGRSVVIGFDARHQSDVFALDSALVLAAAGLRPLLFPSTCPTPVLAYAIRALGTDAGVMCTASHNPARDNGYKVYVGDGAQIIPPVDAEIAAAIGEAAAAGLVPLAPADDPAIERVGPELLEAYLDHVVGLVVPGPQDLRIVYTPMHGVGGAVTIETLRRAGFTDLHEVVEQAEPDPDFPTVAFPNPEEPGALDLAAALAERVGADIVLANDPDADRLGVMVADGSGGVVALNGNQIGALLGERVLATSEGADRLVVTTFVSSHLLARMAEDHDVHYAEVPTGFKWVVRPGLTTPGHRFVFGFEEALGFSVDEAVRDKDGISAALRFAELAAIAKAEGHTVWDTLEALARRHGEHATRTWSWRVEEPDGVTRIAAAMERLRAHPPTQLAGLAVAQLRDLRDGEGLLAPTDALVLDLADGSRVVLRPSGTEPKLKVYVEVVEP